MDSLYKYLCQVNDERKAGKELTNLEKEVMFWQYKYYEAKKNGFLTAEDEFVRYLYILVKKAKIDRYKEVPKPKPKGEEVVYVVYSDGRGPISKGMDYMQDLADNGVDRAKDFADRMHDSFLSIFD